MARMWCRVVGSEKQMRLIKTGWNKFRYAVGRTFIVLGVKILPKDLAQQELVSFFGAWVEHVDEETHT